jgi:uncharacterized protein YndB with AHSA1/START domain
MDYQQRTSSGERLAQGLGWFSIALGLAEVAAPRSVARLIGTRADEQTTTVLRAYGAREIANGVAILAQPDRARWLWSRVAGDAVDLVSLGRAMQQDDTDRGRAMFAIASVAGVTALDLMCARQLSSRDELGMPRERRSRRAGRGGVHVKHSITVNRPIEEVYAFWSNFQNFSKFMQHIEAVRVEGGGRSYWRATAPAGMSVEWTAELIEARENERIAWASIEGSDVEHAGSVTFTRAPGARGTEVHVELTYRPAQPPADPAELRKLTGVL